MGHLVQPLDLKGDISCETFGLFWLDYSQISLQTQFLAL